MFKGNNRLIKIKSSGFQQKLGYNATVKKIFEVLGFGEGTHSSSHDQTLSPPPIDPSDPLGVLNRGKLLRAWVEMGAWLQEYRKANREHLGFYVLASEFLTCVLMSRCCFPHT